jgi:phenylalanyl-tRNA synthetase beta chain
MKISLNWLKDYVAIDAPVADVSRAITFLGFEVEQTISTGAPPLENVVVGEVLTRERHPNADKLSVCTVDVGPAGGIKTIVCGAQNYGVGDRVPVALPGAMLPGNFAIKQSKIRGQLSDGMLCSGREIGIGDDGSGLLILADRPAIGTPINAALPPGDTVFDIEITPNRPDCLSHLGIARELAAWFRLPLSYPQEKFRGELESGAGERLDLLGAVRVGSPEDCPLYSAHIISGVRISPSPTWLQERLRAVGVRPINNVVDVGNYVMLEYGQPLHAFDARKLAGSQIIVRHAADGERIVTLDGRERVLNRGMLVIADAARPVVVAGIMGGENSGVTADTTELVLECAIFRRQSIRATSKRLGLSSDSSYRYERGVDPHTALEAAHRAVDLILASAGGRVVGPIYQVGGDVPWRREILVTPAFLRERLGFDIPHNDMRAALESLELDIVRDTVDAGGGPVWTVSIPSWRDDLDRPIDLVEEVLRLHGTDRIPPARVIAPGSIRDDDPVVRYVRRATDYLVGHDFNECVNLTLRSGAELSTWVSQTAAAELALANPFVEDQSHLRPTLIMGLLGSLKLNQSRDVPASRLAETGRVFIERDGHNFECIAAAFIIADDPERRWKHREPADFYTAKHHVEALAAAAGITISGQMLSPVFAPYSAWQEGHSAAAGEMQDGWIARFGLLNLAMVRSLGIKGKVYAGVFAILPEKLGMDSAPPRHSELSSFPAAWRDLALVVDASTPSATVQEALARAARSAIGDAFAIESVGVFDVYQGRGLPAGKKGLTFSLVFRSPSRTLTDEEVNAAFVRIQRDIAASGEFTVRA